MAMSYKPPISKLNAGVHVYIMIICSLADVGTYSLFLLIVLAV